ncbi:MAG: hypothetical protein AB8B86_07595 [Pseudomonadales bacterium]
MMHSFLIFRRTEKPRLAVLCTTALLTVCSLSACSQYDVTLNNQVLYTPRVIFAEVDVEDSQLGDCLVQTFQDRKHSRALELENLICSNAGIANLNGISNFSELRKLKLNANRIINVEELVSLPKLEILLLADNLIVDPSSLAALPDLLRLDLSKNVTMNCDQLTILSKLRPTLLIDKPSHCKTQ